MAQTSDEFNHAITDGCTTFTAVTCGFCGINHMCDIKHGGMYQEGEYEKLMNIPRTTIHDAPVEYGLLDNTVFVPKCVCDAGVQYQNFLLNNRVSIARFYRAMKTKMEGVVDEFAEAKNAASE